jgi:hypothetical protein
MNSLFEARIGRRERLLRRHINDGAVIAFGKFAPSRAVGGANDAGCSRVATASYRIGSKRLNRKAPHRFVNERPYSIKTY